MGDDTPSEALQRAIRDLFHVESRFVVAVDVQQRSLGPFAWDGVVYIFKMLGRATPPWAYAWTYRAEDGRRRCIVILHAGAINTPQKAVHAYLVGEGRTSRGAVGGCRDG